MKNDTRQRSRIHYTFIAERDGQQFPIKTYSLSLAEGMRDIYLGHGPKVAQKYFAGFTCSDIVEETY